MKHKEITVACAAELKDGEMKQVAVDGVNILLARVNGKYHAVGATCPHYGAPLAEGALSGERIICPWHHACFNVTTGDLEEPPALDALPRYEVRVENENIIVRLPEDAPDRRMPPMTKPDTAADARLFVILGGGHRVPASAGTWRATAGASGLTKHRLAQPVFSRLRRLHGDGRFSRRSRAPAPVRAGQTDGGDVRGGGVVAMPPCADR